MIKYTKRILLFLICLLLTGATPAISQDFAIVDDNPFTVRGYYATIGAALQSGATTIEVRDGQYNESVTIDRSITLMCRDGATILNNGQSISISISAPNVTIRGCEIQGTHTGGEIGDYWHGTGVYTTAPNTRLDGLITRNLRSFSVLAVGTSFLTLENYHFSNVATSPDVPLYAQYAIHLNGTDDSIIRNGFVTGSSQAAGAWYSADRNRIYGNVFLNNWGYVGSGGDYIPRSVYENYGVPVGAENYGNEFYNNTIDGGRGAIELADSLYDSVVRNNTIRNTDSCFVVLGSYPNHAVNLTIEGNHCYSDGVNRAHSNHITGENVLVLNNWFYNYVDNNTGTLYVWGEFAKGTVIKGNFFIENGRVLRASGSEIRFLENSVRGNLHELYLYIDNGFEGIEISDNTFEGMAASVTSNGASNLVITNNSIYGNLWLANQTSNSVVRGNTIYNPNEGGIGLYAPTESVISQNRIRADTPIHQQPGQTNYVLISENFVTNRNGGAVAIPVCSGTNTCRYNYTVGQTP